MLDGLRNGPEPIFDGRMQLPQLVLGLGERDAAVQVDLRASAAMYAAGT